MGEPLSDPDAALRAELTAELARLRRASPLDVLGLSADSPPGEIRPAFLALTKRLHPNRFARHDPSVVRLANEIFLLVRAAYEKASSPRPPGESKSVDVKPPRRDPPSVRDIKPITDPAAAPPPREPRISTPPPEPPARRESTSSPPPSSGGRADDELRAAMAEQRKKRIAAALGSSTSLPSPGPRASVPAVSAPSGTGPPRTGLSAAAARARAAGGSPAPQRGSTRDDRVRAAIGLLDGGQVVEARAAFRALLADQPDDARVRALLHLAAGRELLAAGKPTEARAEFERSIAADPSLVESRDQIASLDKKEGGLLSRWFRK